MANGPCIRFGKVREGGRRCTFQAPDDDMSVTERWEMGLYEERDGGYK